MLRPSLACCANRLLVVLVLCHVCTPPQIRGKHSLDEGRAQEALLDTMGGVERGVLRDWNEMYQCYKDLPTETPQVHNHDTNLSSSLQGPYTTPQK